MRSVSKSMVMIMVHCRRVGVGVGVGEGVEISKSVNVANLCLRWSLKKKRASSFWFSMNTCTKIMYFEV